MVEKEIKITLSIHDVVSTEKVWVKTAVCNGSLHWGEGPDSLRSEKNEVTDSKHLDQNDGTSKLPKEMIRFLGTALTTHCSDEALETSNQREDILCSSAKASDRKRTAYNSVSSDLLELSLRRPQLNKEEEVLQTKHVLNHSIASAFSRFIYSPLFFICILNLISITRALFSLQVGERGLRVFAPSNFYTSIIHSYEIVIRRRITKINFLRKHYLLYNL